MASESKFETWLKTPNGRMVLQESIEVAEIIQSKGRTTYGIGAVIEIVRWRKIKYEKDSEGFKINNIWRPLLARKIMRICPGLAGFFQIREMRSYKV